MRPIAGLIRQRRYEGQATAVFVLGVRRDEPRNTGARVGDLNQAAGTVDRHTNFEAAASAVTVLNRVGGELAADEDRDRCPQAHSPNSPVPR